MALGGGTFVTQNKVLPGSYINFVSATRATSSLSDRGIVAMPLELDWG
ncbi:TPA: phage tail protein, partial [Clostridioides difficile]|nr:phage tail protein [Clostridioides difficile]